jgi:hypothetical protein
MRRIMQRAAIAIAALAILFAANLSGASARTYEHGKTVWFNDVTLGTGDEVAGDLEIMFGSVTCDGGVVDGNVRTYFGSFKELDGCEVGGSVTDAFDGDQVATFVPWAVPRDETTEMARRQTRHIVERLGWDVVVLFAFLLFPVRVRVAMDRVERHPGLSAAAGTFAVVAIAPVFLLLLLSVIGIPLIVVEIAAVFAGIWIGQAAVALLIGRRLYELLRPHATPSPLGALIFGLIVVTAAETLPVVGWAVTAIVWLVGLGAALLALVRETSFQRFAPVSGANAPPSGPPMNRPA